jgi:predicted NBD/HSP70 family sugar kinase
VIKPAGSPDGRSIGVPARQDSLRPRNLALVLDLIANGGQASPGGGGGAPAAGTGAGMETQAGAGSPVSRAELAARTGLTKATVSTLVDALVDAGLVTELQPSQTRKAGRPAAGLVLCDTGPAGLGIEVNVDYLAVCVTDLRGVVRHSAIDHCDQRGRAPGDTLAQAARLAGDAITIAQAQGLRVVGAQLAVPGLVAPGPGGAAVVLVAPNLGWQGVDALRLLRSSGELAALPFGLDNEANYAALGELHAATAAGPPSFLYLSGEIGIGAGIVLDRALFRGTRGWSGEIGHLAVRPGGSRCRCGALGCLETVAGVDAMMHVAGVADRAGLTSLERTALIAEAAQGRAPAALAALREAGMALGVACAAALNILDVDTVVLGGVYPQLAPWLLPPMERELADRVLSAAWSRPHIRTAAAGPDAAALGAATVTTSAVLADPVRFCAPSAGSR